MCKVLSYKRFCGILVWNCESTIIRKRTRAHDLFSRILYEWAPTKPLHPQIQSLSLGLLSTPRFLDLPTSFSLFVSLLLILFSSTLSLSPSFISCPSHSFSLSISFLSSISLYFSLSVSPNLPISPVPISLHILFLSLSHSLFLFMYISVYSRETLRTWSVDCATLERNYHMNFTHAQPADHYIWRLECL